MSLSETEKHGVKLVRQSSDVLFCMPPKKRHLLWLQSPGSVSPSPSTYSPNSFQLSDNDCWAQEPGLSAPGTGDDASISEFTSITLPNKTANVKSSPNQDEQDMVPTTRVTNVKADTDGKLNKQDTSEPIAEKGEPASSPKNPDDICRRNEAGEHFSNHSFKVQQAEEHEMKPSKQLLGSFAVGNCSGITNAVEQETFNPCPDEKVHEDKLNDNILSEKNGLVELCSDRSNWDLNTAMDSWEGSFSDADQKESPADEPRMEGIHNIRSEVRGNHAVDLSDSFRSESNMELQLNSAIDNMTQVRQVSPNLLKLTSSRDANHATGLNLSMSLTCAAAHSMLPCTGTVNNKPFNQGLVDKLTAGRQNVKPTMLKNVKNEPREVPTVEVAAKVDILNNLGLVRNAVVKSETQIETSQYKSGELQQKDQLSKSQSHPLDSLSFKHIVQEKDKTFPYPVPQASVGSCKNVNSLLAEVPIKGIPQTEFTQVVGLNVSMESVSEVKLELPESGKLGTNVKVTENGCSSFGENLVNSGTALESQIGNDCAGMPSECSETVDKVAFVSEFVSSVPTDDSECAAVQSLPGKLLDSNIIDQVNDDILDRYAEVPGGDSLVSLLTQSLGGKEHIDSCGNSMVGQTNKGVLFSSQLSDVKPCVAESLKCLGDLVLAQVISRRHDDDDIEDGEVRDSQQTAVKNLLVDGKIKNEHDDAATASVESVPVLAAVLNETGKVNETQNLPEVQYSTTDFSVNMHNENMLSSIATVEQGPSTPKLPPAREPCKKKPVKAEIPDHAVESSEQKLLPTKPSDESLELPVKDNAGDGDSCKMNPEGSLSFPIDCKADTIPKSDGTSRNSKKIMLTSKDSSSERTKTSDRKWMSPKSEREMSSDQLVKGDGPLRRGNRDETCSNGPVNIEKEWKKDETSRKAGSEYIHRGRTEKTFHNDRNPEVGYVYSHRFARHKNLSELTTATAVSAACSVENAGRVMRNLLEDDIGNFSRVPSRRRSPGGRDRPVGRMVRRRDISPGRCIDAAGPDAALLKREENFIRNLREDMLDNSNFTGPRPTFERGEQHTFMRRRSLSPIERRGPPRLPRVCSPSSRRRPRSPWSPSQRSPDDFHGHPEGIPCRSPPAALRVDRIRSSNEHDLYLEDMIGRRHASPPPQYMPHLHDGMRDVSPLRTYNFTARNARSFQRNTRNFHLIDTEMEGEVDYLGPPLHSGQLRELPEEDVDDGWNCNKRHDLIRPPFRRYNIAGNADDEDFNFRIERNPPLRRFHADVKEELPERDGSIRHRMGEMPRRLRTLEERGDVCQRDGGQGWPDPSFGDVRMKRRRY